MNRTSEAESVTSKSTLKKAEARISYKGRFLYLETLQEQWPDLLKSLFEDCLPSMIAAQATGSDGTPPSIASDLRSTAAGETCLEIINNWALSYGIRNGWMIDAAVQTLASMVSATEPARWVYIAPDLPIPLFAFRANAAWIPFVLPFGEDRATVEFTWNDFRARLQRQFDDALKAYRKEIAEIWGEDNRSHTAQALWTVWWQQGMSPDDIQSKMKFTTSKTNIQNGVHRFAQSIGLTLRESKACPSTTKI